MSESATAGRQRTDSTHGLCDTLATRQHWLGAIAVCLTLAAFTIVAAVIGSLPGPEIKPLVPITTTVWALADVLTGYLLLAQFCISGRRALAILALTYGVAGWCSVGFLCTFPGLFLAADASIGARNMFVYFGLIWHWCFPVLAVVSLINDSPRRGTVARASVAATAVVCAVSPVILTGCAAAMLARWHDALPYLVVNGHLQPVNLLFVQPSIIALNALACSIIVARRTRTTTLQLWLCVALFSACLDSFLVISSTKLYSLAWDIGKALNVCSASTILIVILCEITILYSRQSRLAQRLERDLEARSRMEAALRASDERFRQIEQHTPVGLALVALDGSLTRVNPALCALWGYSEQELLSIDRESLTHPDYWAAERERVAQLVAGTLDTYEVDKRYLHKDGHTIWCHTSVSLVRDERRTPLYIISQVQDISARIAAEEALAVAQESVLAAAEAKTRFLATMSHEIRTPMNGIVGMAELLSYTRLDAEQQECVSIVHDSGRSLLRILDDVLDFSKINAGKLALEVVDFDLPAQIRSIVGLLEPQFGAKGLMLTTYIEPAVPVALRGDPCRLRQILLNLVGNALKFTPAGGTVRIALWVEPNPDAASMIRFTIADNGVGIAPDVRHRLFQPFSQGDGSTTRIYGGTGLGLSICKQLVELMDGNIGVDSEPGIGSRFWFTIPAGRDARDVRTHVLPAPSPRREDGMSGRPERLLLADDNAVNTLLAVKQFARLGFQIRVVVNGQEAVTACSNERFDIIFMDCHMPVMDGYAATRAIRALPEATQVHVPIVAMTANAQSTDREACLSAGMDDYVAKPVSLADLECVLERWLPSTREAATAPVPCSL